MFPVGTMNNDLTNQDMSLLDTVYLYWISARDVYW